MRGLIIEQLVGTADERLQLMRQTTLQRKLVTVFGCLSLFVLTSNDLAADAPKCSTRSHSHNIAIIVCPPDLGTSRLHDAGVQACASVDGVCNAWIWANSELAPQTAPKNDQGLDREAVKNAVAVWVDKAQRLIVLRKVK